jgi:hypothetical protein
MIRPVHDVSAIALALVLSSGVLGAVAPSITTAQARSEKTVAGGRSLLQSRELWATVDVCNPKDQPNTIGIRGSMPGDGHPHDVMYMGFSVQYLDATTKKWVDLGKGGDSGMLKVGSGASARQGGFSVGLAPVAGRPAFTLQGYVVFQWRRGGTVVHQATRTTSTGHQSVTDADPAGYSAAQCAIG